MNGVRSVAVLVCALLLCLANMPVRAECGRRNGTGLPTLPVLTPASDGAISLRIRAERASTPVMIGDLPVTDVPVFMVQPEAGTRLRASTPLGIWVTISPRIASRRRKPCMVVASGRSNKEAACVFN